MVVGQSQGTQRLPRLVSQPEVHIDDRPGARALQDNETDHHAGGTLAGRLEKLPADHPKQEFALFPQTVGTATAFISPALGFTFCLQLFWILDRHRNSDIPDFETGNRGSLSPV